MNSYIYKCEILIDLYLEKPLDINVTQAMVDELKDEGFINDNGNLTAGGILAGKILAMLFGKV